MRQLPILSQGQPSVQGAVAVGNPGFSWHGLSCTPPQQFNLHRTHRTEWFELLSSLVQNVPKPESERSGRNPNAESQIEHKDGAAGVQSVNQTKSLPSPSAQWDWVWVDAPAAIFAMNWRILCFTSLRNLANLKRSHDQGVCIFEKHHWWTPNNTFANRRKGLQAYQHPKKRMRHATLRDITHMQKFNIKRLRKIAESQNSSACTSNPCIWMRCLGLDRCLVMIWGRTYTTQAGTECWCPRHSCKTACHMSVYYCKITRISDYCLFLLFILG